MGIEAIGSIGSAMGSVASGIGKAGSSLDSMFGPKMGSIMPEGGTIDLIGGINKPGFSPVGGEILFQAPSELPSPTQAVTQVESILSQARFNVITPVAEPRITGEAAYWFTDVPSPRVIRPTEVLMPEIEPITTIVEFPRPQTVTFPILEPKTETAGKAMTKTSTENRTSTAVVPVILPQPAPAEQEVEEIVEEKKEKQELKERLEEDIETEKQIYLEDENASTQRRVEVREAVLKARIEADRLGLKNIAGWLVAKFLPGEHEGNRSQVVRKTGPDGSYQETVEAIAGAGELESREKAVEKFDAIVAEKKPVKVGKNGTPVGNIDIARIFKYRLIKPVQAHAEVIKRVVKKKMPVSQAQNSMPVVTTEKKEIKTEPSLEELNPALAEVFQKAV